MPQKQKLNYELRKCVWAMWLAWFPLSAAADCRKLELAPLVPGIVGAQIDQAWSGTRVGYAALEAGNDVYFGYYNASRQFTVAEYRRDKHDLCTAKLDSVFKGWDSHNFVTLAVDAAGYVHVAGNMHASPLIYARSQQPGSIEGLSLSPMIGRDENRTTYPRFFTSDSGDLLFLYRQGGSGDGRWVLNRQVGREWRRVQDTLFTDRWKKGHVSAYPSQFVRGPDGTFHVAIVWRRTPDVATNFAVSYAKTKDFKSWLSHAGKAVPLPIGPETADTVEWPGEGAGLLNSAKVALDPAGQPVVTYTRYGEGGKNAVIAARPSATKWAITTIATADRQTPLVGKGSLPDVPRFRELDFSPEAGTASIQIGFSGEPTRRYRLSPETLQIQGPPIKIAATPKPVFKLSFPEGLAEARESVVWTKTVGKLVEGIPGSALHYVTQGTNRDRQRECTPKAPKACAPPPSPLYYVEQAVPSGGDDSSDESANVE